AAPPPRSAAIASVAPAAASPAPAVAVAPAPEAAPARPAPSLRAVPPPLVTTEAHAPFRAIVERLPEDRHELRAFLARAAPLEAKAGSLVLAFAPGEPFVTEVERSAALVERVASEAFGVPTKLTVERDSPRAASVATLAALDAEEEERKRRA